MVKLIVLYLHTLYSKSGFQQFMQIKCWYSASKRDKCYLTQVKRVSVMWLVAACKHSFTSLKSLLSNPSWRAGMFWANQIKYKLKLSFYIIPSQISRFVYWCFTNFIVITVLVSLFGHISLYLCHSVLIHSTLCQTSCHTYSFHSFRFH